MFDVVYGEEFQKRRVDCQKRVEHGYVCHHHGMPISGASKEKVDAIEILVRICRTGEENRTAKIWDHCVSMRNRVDFDLCLSQIQLLQKLSLKEMLGSQEHLHCIPTNRSMLVARSQ